MSLPLVEVALGFAWLALMVGPLPGWSARSRDDLAVADLRAGVSPECGW